MKFRLNVDEEFKKIAPPISRSEYAELEKSIMSEGCRDPIIIWNGVIVDGHNRYVICRHHDIQFNIKTIYFESREEAGVQSPSGEKMGLQIHRWHLSEREVLRNSLHLQNIYVRCCDTEENHKRW